MIMKSVGIAALVLAVSSCGGDNDSELVGAHITDFRTEECYCCPSVTLDVGGEIYLVDDFPDSELRQEELPKSVVVEISDYQGECPNRDASVFYH